MQRAAAASVALHVLLLGGVYVLTLQPRMELEDAAFDPVMIEILTLEGTTVATPSEIQSDATEALVAAGAQAVEAMEPEALEPEVLPVETTAAAEPVESVKEVLEPTRTAEIRQAEPQAPGPEAVPMVEAVAPAPAAAPSPETEVSADVLTVASLPAMEPATATPLWREPTAALVVDAVPASIEMETETETTPAEAVEADIVPDEAAVPVLAPANVESAEPVRTALLSPVLEEELVVAPIPKPRLARPEPEPEPEPVREPERTRAKPAPEPEPERRAPSTAGSGGKSDANSAASASSGSEGRGETRGGAAASRYPSQVQAKLRRALRFPSNARGAEGEVHVRFVVAASGSVSGITVVRSSGYDVLDAAAIATVKRAAPFPRIPEDAGRSSWSFTMPLTFRR